MCETVHIPDRGVAVVTWGWWTDAAYVVGDVRRVVARLPDGSIDLIMTSPPFLALRSYLPTDHPHKSQEIGSERTPGEYLDALLDCVEDFRRVLAPHGSMCIELGDTYSGSGGAGGDYRETKWRDSQPKFEGSARRGRGASSWPLAKSLCLIAESFRWAMVYGRNPFTGRETPTWRLRNVVRWCKPNPPVGALGDKFRPATTELMVFCTGGKRWFDLDAVRTPSDKTGGSTNFHPYDGRDKRGYAGPNTANNGGAPPLDWWKISTQPYKGSHYATYPEALCRIPILSMCPERVCWTCGKPSERTVERQSAGVGFRRSRENVHNQPTSTGFYRSYRSTIGWTDCGHDDWRPGVVLDPFAGSGTTLKVALDNNRSAIGIDLDERDVDLAIQRVGREMLIIK